MRLDLRTTLGLLVALSIALLPFRFGHAVGGAELLSAQPVMDHADTNGCDYGNTDPTYGCSGHTHDGSAIDDCCGDHCSSTVFFIAAILDLNLSPSREFARPVFWRLPAPVRFAAFRPPIAIS